MTAAERYMLAAKDAGCPRDQVENLLRANIVMQPRQLLACAAARACDYWCPRCLELYGRGQEPVIDCPDCGPSMIGYGGARVGGKSFWGIAQVFADDCARYDGLKFLYVRQSLGSGKEAIQDLRKGVLRHIPHSFNGQDLILTRDDNGSSIKIRHFRHESDIEGFQGIEYDGLLAEEATQLTAAKILDAMTSMRTSKPGWRPRAYLTFNPGGVGHAYIKKTFVLPMRAERDGGAKQTTTRFIPATVADNRMIDPGYRSILNRLIGVRRKTWLEGDWDAMTGQFFENWDYDVHVRPLDRIGENWDVWVAIDYGMKHPFVAYLFAKDSDGVLWVVDEHVSRKWLAAANVDAIKAMLRRHGLEVGDLSRIVAGSDMAKTERDGKTPLSDYTAAGLRITWANMSRVSGAAEISQRLGDPLLGVEPSLFVTPRCKRLIESLPEMVHDPGREEDVLKVDCDEDGQGGDDCYDAFRYGVMEAARPTGGVVRTPG